MRVHPDLRSESCWGSLQRSSDFLARLKEEGCFYKGREKEDKGGVPHNNFDHWTARVIKLLNVGVCNSPFNKFYIKLKHACASRHALKTITLSVGCRNINITRRFADTHMQHYHACDLIKDKTLCVGVIAAREGNKSLRVLLNISFNNRKPIGHAASYYSSIIHHHHRFHQRNTVLFLVIT